jgi:gliding motility-associated protein GldM
MAGAKETPRQKMIGMMYLVLTALLALNVSADILDAFAIVNDGLEKTNASVENKIEDYYNIFELQYSRQPEKAQVYWDKANEIRVKTDEIINFIEKEIKVPLVLETENITEEQLLNSKDPKKALLRNTEKISDENRRVFYEFELKNIGAKDKYDAATNFMINNGNATILKNKIQEYRSFVVNTVEDAGLSNYSKYVGLLTDVDHNGEKIIYTDNDGQELSWENKNFEHIILTAEIAILNKIVGEIQTTEYDAITALFKQIGSSDFKFESVQARVIQKSDFIIKGQNYEAEIFIAAADTSKAFDVKYFMGTDDYNKAKGEPVKLNSKEGKVILSFPTTTVGMHKYAGRIEIPRPDGTMALYDFNESFQVVAPSATVAPTKMMVMYEELQNPISVSAPGITSDDIMINVEGGKYTKDKNDGDYFVEVNKGAKIVKVKVSAKDDKGKIVDLGTQEFRVKKVPDPVVKIGDITGGKVEKEVLLSIGRVMAVMKDFDFEGFNYVVDSYTVSTYRGTFIDKNNKGPKFSNEVIELISNAQTGQRIQFQDICVKSPKGEVRNVGSINIQIK